MADKDCIIVWNEQHSTIRRVKDLNSLRDDVELYTFQEAKESLIAFFINQQAGYEAAKELLKTLDMDHLSTYD